MNEKVYGVIFEWKNEQPLIRESRLLTYDEARATMNEGLLNARVIRVAMFKAVYVNGNEALIPTESADV